MRRVVIYNDFALTTHCDFCIYLLFKTRPRFFRLFKGIDDFRRNSMMSSYGKQKPLRLESETPVLHHPPSVYRFGHRLKRKGKQGLFTLILQTQRTEWRTVERYSCILKLSVPTAEEKEGRLKDYSRIAYCHIA